MAAMANYVASGWKRDLTHMVGCCWEVQVADHDREVPLSDGQKKKHEWTEIKELTPLKYMPYVARLFHEVTGKDLQGLGQFTGWIGRGGYYHWRVVQQGLVHLVPHLQDEPAPRMPDVHPSGWPLPVAPPSTGTPTTRALTRPQGGGPRPTQSKGQEAQPQPSHSGGAMASS